ncbi:MAG TPA: PAS domain-containing protein [Micropepsaceae bacterium]|nr:PAS domain-containing protein [Micropepsaceae bacterium]
MAADLLLRAQLSFADQREVLDYWYALAANGLPSRAAVNPGAIKRRLAQISILVLDPAAKGSVRVRLAGTGLRDAYGRDVTGQPLGEIEAGERFTYWLHALKRVITTGEPAAGVISLGGLGKPHLDQHWLRLPLSSDGRHVDGFLGYDRFVPTEAAQRAAQQPSAIGAG